MNTTPSRRLSSALRTAAPALLLALAGTLAGASAAAAGTGDAYSLTLTYDDMVAAPSVGSFVLGAAVAGHPGTFSVSDFSVVIGPPGFAYDYDLPGAGLQFDTVTGEFGEFAGATAFTSYGDQLDLLDTNNWKTDDFLDPHPICDVAHCGGFHFGSYATAAAPVPEPDGLWLTLAALATLALALRRRRAG